MYTCTGRAFSEGEEFDQLTDLTLSVDGSPLLFPIIWNCRVARRLRHLRLEWKSHGAFDPDVYNELWARALDALDSHQLETLRLVDWGQSLPQSFVRRV